MQLPSRIPLAREKIRNAGHMKKFLDPGTERSATETELPTHPRKELFWTKI